jgi:hypothetical protein
MAVKPDTTKRILLIVAMLSYLLALPWLIQWGTAYVDWVKWHG